MGGDCELDCAGMVVGVIEKDLRYSSSCLLYLLREVVNMTRPIVMTVMARMQVIIPGIR